MPKRKYKWWSSVTSAICQPGNEYVERALMKSRLKSVVWDYEILTDCIEKRYRRREKTIFEIAVDHGTTEGVAWYIVKKFYFDVAAEMGFVGNHSQ